MAKKPDGFAKVKDAFKHCEGVTYLNGEELKNVQRVLLQMLKDFIEVAERNHIDYSLSGGTLLGAVRHQGFIPWDDDMDLHIPRKSFDRFKKIFEKELGDRYTLSAPEISEHYGLSVSQFKKKDTVYKTFNNITEPDEECGICIDLFILENTPDHALVRKAHGFLCLGVGYLLNCRKVYDYVPDLMKALDHQADNAIRSCFQTKMRIGRLLRFIPLDSFTRFTYRIYSLCKNHNSRYVTIPSGRVHYFGEMDTRKNMCHVKKAVFEGVSVSIPYGEVSYLTRLFGTTYMEIPPVEKREQHPLLKIQL